MNRLFIFLCAVGLAAAHGEVPGPEADRLVQAVRAALPQGWSASCGQGNEWITISRDQPVLLWHQGIANANPDTAEKCQTGKPAPQQYQFVLGLEPKMSLADYQRLHAENAELDKQQDTLFQQLRRMRTPLGMGYDAFQPESDGQRAAVAQYETVKKAHHRLPDFYFGDLSLDWRINSPKYPSSAPEDKKIRQECERVRENVTHVFSPYGSDEKKTPPAPNQ